MRGSNSKPVPTPKTNFVLAQAVGVDLSAFILSAAMERAESVLDNQRRRELSNQSWELMNQLIAEPAQPTLALKALMKRKNSDGRQA